MICVEKQLKGELNSPKKQQLECVLEATWAMPPRVVPPHPPSVWSLSLCCSPLRWRCGYLVLPVSYCKAWWEQQTLSRFCMWIGGGQRGQGMERGRRRGQCLWMRVAMVTKFQQVLVYSCCANDMQSVSKSLIPHEFITVAATKICYPGKNSNLGNFFSFSLFSQY